MLFNQEGNKETFGGRYFLLSLKCEKTMKHRDIDLQAISSLLQSFETSQNVFFFLRITSEKAQTAVQKQKSSKYYLESPAAKRLISDMAEITFTSQSQQLRAGVPAEHSRSTHPDKSCYQVQEGDGNTVLALGLLHAHQKVSIAPSIHSLCTVK